MLEVLNLIFCKHSTLKMDNERNLHDQYWKLFPIFVGFDIYDV